MKTRGVRERMFFKWLEEIVIEQRLPDKQLERDRWATFRRYFRPSLTKRKGFEIRRARDAKRRAKARKAIWEEERIRNQNGQEPLIPTNRAMRRAMGVRGYGFGLGEKHIPKGRK